MHLILASKSPRRRDILQSLGIRFDILTADTDESCLLDSPEQFVEEVSRRKGAAIDDAVLLAHGYQPEECIVLSADTIVACDDHILGKPHNRQEGEAMLRMLSGRTHRVVSGISVHGYTAGGKSVTATGHTVTQVEFSDILPEDMNRYLATDEPYDKAGGYAIQGHAALWIKGIRGCYYNVVGLPVYDVSELILKTFGLRLQDFS